VKRAHPLHYFSITRVSAQRSKFISYSIIIVIQLWSAKSIALSTSAFHRGVRHRDPYLWSHPSLFIIELWSGHSVVIHFKPRDVPGNKVLLVELTPSLFFKGEATIIFRILDEDRDLTRGPWDVSMPVFNKISVINTSFLCHSVKGYQNSLQLH